MRSATCRATLAVRPESVSTTASAEAAGTLKHPCADVSTYSPAKHRQIRAKYCNLEKTLQLVLTARAQYDRPILDMIALYILLVPVSLIKQHSLHYSTSYMRRAMVLLPNAPDPRPPTVTESPSCIKASLPVEKMLHHDQ